MNARISSTPLAHDVRGSSVRVVVARDKYTVANISPGMNDREEYARMFAAAPEMRAIIEMMARMDTPTDGVTDQERADDIMADLDDDRLCSDASALYELIRRARTISNML